mmetsp:Transcript_583/g.1133  ORF Transcript_583/g.1133 Transcript_583/m.1133 type:complete len:325 (-) Transcript_583:65-1039(-)
MGRDGAEVCGQTHLNDRQSCEDLPCCNWNNRDGGCLAPSPDACCEDCDSSGGGFFKGGIQTHWVILGHSVLVIFCIHLLSIYLKRGVFRGIPFWQWPKAFLLLLRQQEIDTLRRGIQASAPLPAQEEVALAGASQPGMPQPGGVPGQYPAAYPPPPSYAADAPPYSAPPPPYSAALPPDDVGQALPFPEPAAPQAAQMSAVAAKLKSSLGGMNDIEDIVKDPANSHLFSSLSPSDFAELVKTIKFSMDQPQGAVLLARGLTQRKGLTCAHIAAAIQAASSLSHQDVLKELLPLCSDVASNKERILDVFTGYDRTTAQREIDKYS